MSHLSRRRFLILTGQAGAGALLLAGCGEDGSSSPSGEVEFWRAFPDSESERFVQEAVVGAYNAEHSGSATLVPKPVDSFDQLIRTSLAAGEGPDIVSCTGPTGALAYQNAGYLAPLDEYADRFGWSERLQPWALGTGRIDDALYSVPANYASMVMFYNPAVFDQHGWQTPVTREDFEALCEDASGRGIVPVAAGNAEYRAASEWHATIFLNHAAAPEAVYQALRGEISWSDPVFVDAMELLNGYFQKGWYGGGVEAYLTAKFAGVNASLASGEAAMLPSGTWTFAELPAYFGAEAGNDQEWDWAPLPRLSDDTPADTFPLSVGTSFAINANTADVDAAAEFLDWLIDGKARQVDGLAQVNLAPAPLVFADADFPDDVDERVRRLYVELGQARSFSYPTWTFFPPKSNTFIYESVDKLITGQLTAAEYCAGLDEVFSAELADGKVPPFPEPSAES